MNKGSKIYVAGHKGLAGSAIVRELERKGYTRIIKLTRDKCDLRDPEAVYYLFETQKPEYVFMAAAHAGGIKRAIDFPVEMQVDNIRIQTNILECAKDFRAKKLIFLSSSCVYPVDAYQPYKEEYIGTGKTDENWSYALAKLAGTELCRAYHRQYGCNFMTVVPCNMYGINDNFDLEYSHVIPALIRKFHECETVEVWGGRKIIDGEKYYYTPAREFLFSDDFARAVVMLMETKDYEDLYNGVINIGAGDETEIATLVDITEDIVSPGKKVVWNREKPFGVNSKLMDSGRIRAMGWEPKVGLREGVSRVYVWYKERVSTSSCF